MELLLAAAVLGGMGAVAGALLSILPEADGSGGPDQIPDPAEEEA